MILSQSISQKTVGAIGSPVSPSSRRTFGAFGQALENVDPKLKTKQKRSMSEYIVRPETRKVPLAKMNSLQVNTALIVEMPLARSFVVAELPIPGYANLYADVMNAICVLFTTPADMVSIAATCKVWHALIQSSPLLKRYRSIYDQGWTDAMIEDFKTNTVSVETLRTVRLLLAPHGPRDKFAAAFDKLDHDLLMTHARCAEPAIKLEVECILLNLGCAGRRFGDVSYTTFCYHTFGLKLQEMMRDEKRPLIQVKAIKLASKETEATHYVGTIERKSIIQSLNTILDLAGGTILAPPELKLPAMKLAEQCFISRNCDDLGPVLSLMHQLKSIAVQHLDDPDWLCIVLEVMRHASLATLLRWPTRHPNGAPAVLDAQCLDPFIKMIAETTVPVDVQRRILRVLHVLHTVNGVTEDYRAPFYRAHPDFMHRLTTLLWHQDADLRVAAAEAFRYTVTTPGRIRAALDHPLQPLDHCCQLVVIDPVGCNVHYCHILGNAINFADDSLIRELALRSVYLAALTKVLERDEQDTQTKVINSFQNIFGAISRFSQTQSVLATPVATATPRTAIQLFRPHQLLSHLRSLESSWNAKVARPASRAVQLIYPLGDVDPAAPMQPMIPTIDALRSMSVAARLDKDALLSIMAFTALDDLGRCVGVSRGWFQFITHEKRLRSFKTNGLSQDLLQSVATHLPSLETLRFIRCLLSPHSSQAPVLIQRAADANLVDRMLTIIRSPGHGERTRQDQQLFDGECLRILLHLTNTQASGWSEVHAKILPYLSQETEFRRFVQADTATPSDSSRWFLQLIEVIARSAYQSQDHLRRCGLVANVTALLHSIRSSSPKFLASVLGALSGLASVFSWRWDRFDSNTFSGGDLYRAVEGMIPPHGLLVLCCTSGVVSRLHSLLDHPNPLVCDEAMQVFEQAVYIRQFGEIPLDLQIALVTGDLYIPNREAMEEPAKKPSESDGIVTTKQDVHDRMIDINHDSSRLFQICKQILSSPHPITLQRGAMFVVWRFIEYEQSSLFGSLLASCGLCEEAAGRLSFLGAPAVVAHTLSHLPPGTAMGMIRRTNLLHQLASVFSEMQVGQGATGRVLSRERDLIQLLLQVLLRASEEEPKVPGKFPMSEIMTMIEGVGLIRALRSVRDSRKAEGDYHWPQALEDSTNTILKFYDSNVEAAAKLISVPFASQEYTPAEVDAFATATHIHAGVSCDKCGMSPLVGTRWKCDQCYNLDLCHACSMATDVFGFHTKAHHLTVQPPPPSSV